VKCLNGDIAAVWTSR